MALDVTTYALPLARTIADMRKQIVDWRKQGEKIALVPTMGALHAGHVSLIDAARSECDFVVTTIFVNPTQFGPQEDFQKYPRTLDNDLRKCRDAGCDLVFTPDTSQMYSDDSESHVVVRHLTQRLEGRTRPDHFQGVTTVVAKLFNITLPHKAYFGQKDFQQQLVIRRMVRDLDFGLQVVTCPIVRGADGLAMSSRNRYLSPKERESALVLSRALELADRMALQAADPIDIQNAMKQLISAADRVVLDYAVVLNDETLAPLDPSPATAVALIAAKVGETRLIDNRLLTFQP